MTNPEGTVFFPFPKEKQDMDQPGGPCNGHNYTVLRGEVTGRKDEKIVVVAESREYLVSPELCFKEMDHARYARFRFAHDEFKRRALTRLMKSTPEAIRPTWGPTVTGNLARWHERYVMKTFNGAIGKDSPAQVITLLTITLDDIHVLMGILEALPFMGDYAKKKVGSLAIMELQSMITLIEGGGRKRGTLDANPIGLAQLDKNYFDKEFQEFGQRLKALENQYGYRHMRNKMVAHRDLGFSLFDWESQWSHVTLEGIQAYWTQLTGHLDAVLPKYWPAEARTISMTSAAKPFGVSLEEGDEEYVPFDKFAP